MKNKYKGIITVVVVLLVISGVYIFSTKKTAQDQMGQNGLTYDISALQIKFNLSTEFYDLTYAVVKLENNDQAVNSVAFSSKRLEAVGCDAKSGPLGYLTYRNDVGGDVVGNAAGSDVYFLKPKGGCQADLSLQNWQSLQKDLKSLVGY